MIKRSAKTCEAQGTSRALIRLRTVSLALLLCLVLFPVTAFAAIETYQGTLIPKTYDPPIPIVLELENSYGSLSGSAKTSSPMSGDGRITSGEKYAGMCRLTIDLGSGMRVRLEGRCLSTSFEGNYTLYSGKDRREGSFRLKRLQHDSGLSESERRRLAEATSNACLKDNTMCLVSCPRGDYNAEFLCVTSCRHKREACNAKAKQLLETPAPSF